MIPGALVAGECDESSACGVCELCRMRARRLVERIVRKEVKDGKKGKERESNTVIRMCALLDLYEDGMGDEEKERLNQWAYYCAAMASMGMRSRRG